MIKKEKLKPEKGLCDLCLHHPAVYLILDEGGEKLKVCDICEKREYNARRRL